MKTMMFALLVSLTTVSAAWAQKPADDKAAPAVHEGNTTVSIGEITPTPEMWFYEQERRRHDDPEQMVRAAAEARAAQRTARLNAMAWFGLSNSRPNCSPDPVHGNYAPRWAANGYMPSQWIGGGGGTTVILQAERGVSRY